MLSELLKPKSVVVLSTNSSLAELYVYDALKYKANSSKQAVIQIKDKKSFDSMLEKLSFEPMMASKWVFEIDFSSVRSAFLKNKNVFEKSDNAFFLVKCQKYPDFLKAKEGIACTSLYLHSIRGIDADFLFSAYLSKDLQRYLSNNYGAEKCFELYNYFLDGGKPILDKKGIQEQLGTGESSTKDFIISLLKDYKGTKRSIKMQLQRKTKDLEFLLDAIGYKSLQSFMASDLKNMIAVKQLYLEGVFYDSITKHSIPDGYDFEKLIRYNAFFDEIVSIPLKRFIFLLSEIKGSYWRSNEDAFNFIYHYFNTRQDDCF